MTRGFSNQRTGIAIAVDTIAARRTIISEIIFWFSTTSFFFREDTSDHVNALVKLYQIDDSQFILNHLFTNGVFYTKARSDEVHGSL